MGSSKPSLHSSTPSSYSNSNISSQHKFGSDNNNYEFFYLFKEPVAAAKHEIRIRFEKKDFVEFRNVSLFANNTNVPISKYRIT